MFDFWWNRNLHGDRHEDTIHPVNRYLLDSIDYGAGPQTGKLQKQRKELGFAVRLQLPGLPGPLALRLSPSALWWICLFHLGFSSGVRSTGLFLKTLLHVTYACIPVCPQLHPFHPNLKTEERKITLDTLQSVILHYKRCLEHRRQSENITFFICMSILELFDISIYLWIVFMLNCCSPVSGPISKHLFLSEV